MLTGRSCDAVTSDLELTTIVSESHVTPRHVTIGCTCHVTCLSLKERPSSRETSRESVAGTKEAPNPGPQHVGLALVPRRHVACGGLVEAIRWSTWPTDRRGVVGLERAATEVVP
jgi:hypothetical protein